MKKLILIVTLLALAVPSFASHKHPKAAPKPLAGPEAVALLDRTFQPFIDSKNLKGLVAGVDLAGNTLTRFYGSSGRQGLALDEHTLFEIASVTKTFTGLCLADLVREGKMTLEDPLQKYLPKGYRAPFGGGREITLLDLATHTSGLPMPGPSDHLFPGWLSPTMWKVMFLHVATWDWSNPTLGINDGDVYAMLSRYQLTRLPGTQWQYSNLGMGVLGMVMARTDGDASYAALVARRVTGPLGMPDTFVDLPTAREGRLAQGYNEAGKPAAHLKLGAFAGAGALKSDLADLMKYLALHLGEREDLPGLSASAMATHRIYRSLNEGEHQRFLPLSWHFDQPSGFYYHSGTGLGYHSYIAFNPDTKAGLVLLSNSAAQVVEEIGPELLKALEGLPARIPTPTVAVDLPVEELKKYEGRYRLNKDSVYVFTRSGKGLDIAFDAKKHAMLWPKGDGSFFCKEWDCRVDFKRDAGGKVAGADIKMYYNTYPLEKL
jgi:CubicO group peptidase (beta-lactamase class C family)